MKRMWLLIGSFILGAPLRAGAGPVKMDAAPKVEESTPESDKAALREASAAADQWAASKKADTPQMAEEAGRASDEETKGTSEQETNGKSALDKPVASSSLAPSVASSPSPTAPPEAPGQVANGDQYGQPLQPQGVGAAKPAPNPRVSRPGLNEMKGKLLSKSYDPKTVRLVVEGGLNVEFTYDAQTSIMNGGEIISMEDLNYNDELIVRYSGKELYAVEMDRVSKAPRPE